jgi:hypothetical protein
VCSHLNCSTIDFSVFVVDFLIFKFHFFGFYGHLLPCSINRLESHPLTVHNIVVALVGGDVR